MRGKATAGSLLGVDVGIIPAYVGKRLLSLSPLFCNTDHPRVCGEKRCEEIRKRLLSGSPPRMRGKELCTAEEIGKPGITPAYAGKRYTAVAPPSYL